MSTTDAKSSATSASEADDINKWPPDLQRLKRNDPTLISLHITVDHARSGRRGGCYCPRQTEDWQRLGDAIATNTNVRRLALNQIDLHGGETFTLYMSQFLENNTSLTSLSATNYHLGVVGSCLLSYTLARMSSSLTYLDLSSTVIGDEACQELVMALRSGHLRLRSLELNGNTIQNAGCVAVASLLKNPNSMLIRLYVDNNSINDEGAMALADGLTNNKCLKTLSIHGNTAITSRGYTLISTCHPVKGI